MIVTAARRITFCTSLLLALAVSARSFAAAEDKVDYIRDVRPILAQACLKCHGVDDKARKGKLRLDDRESAIKPAKSGETAIIPGKPEASELVRRVFTKDEDDVMPPASTKVMLTEQQKETLKKWISEGAKYKPHWAFAAPQRPTVPELPVELKQWVRNPIDAFVLARLEKEGLKPTPEADRVTLVRRLYLDLIGLPPTPEEADAFLK